MKTLDFFVPATVLIVMTLPLFVSIIEKLFINQKPSFFDLLKENTLLQFFITAYFVFTFLTVLFMRYLWSK